ncbi:MAG: ester cyclase [Granulosicoccus sp.]
MCINQGRVLSSVLKIPEVKMEPCALCRNQANKERVRAYWDAIDSASTNELPDVAASCLAENFCWKGPAPLGVIVGPRSLAERMLIPLKQAMPDMKRQIHLFMGGQSVNHVDADACDAYWVAGTGYLSGMACQDFLGIPAIEHPLRIRWSEFIRFDGDIMIESQMILDFVDWFDQIGLSVLPKSRGAEHVFPVATGFDGVLTESENSDETAQTLRLGHDLLYGGLNGFDQNALVSMGMADYFHPNLKWYGPGGIGACLSFSEFEQFHQKPWLDAFPDRKVVGIESLFAEGRLLAASGVAGVEATHTGSYLGEKASGASLKISGIDFWLRSDGQFTENWVFVDMIDLFKQMGIDLFERMAMLRDRKRSIQ